MQKARLLRLEDQTGCVGKAYEKYMPKGEPSNNVPGQGLNFML